MQKKEKTNNQMIPLNDNSDNKMKRAVDFLEQKVMSRLVDTEGVDGYESVMLGLIYRDLAPQDADGPISIKMVKEFLENVVKPSNEQKFKKLWSYYDFQGAAIPEKKADKMRIVVENFLAGFRTIENAYLYCSSFRNQAESIAKKLDTGSEEMSVIEKNKWLRIWVLIIRDQMLFWGDLDENAKLIGKENSERFENYHFFPEMMVFLNQKYFTQLKDGEIVLDMIKSMLNLYPEKVRNRVLEFGEIGTDKPDYLKLGTIRREIKQSMFKIPWHDASYIFCTKYGIEQMTPEILVKAVEAYRNGIEDGIETYMFSYYNVYNKFKVQRRKVYKICDNLEITCQEELEMYIEVYRWLQAHPEFRFGKENKTLAEYGIEAMSMAKPGEEKEAMVIWIEDMGYARRESIDYELAKIILRPEENAKIFLEYGEGRMAAEQVYEAIGFVSDEQAQICCDINAKISKCEGDAMEKALKRIKMFGKQNSLKGDSIYSDVFGYLLKNRKEVLPKKIIRLYGGKR